MTTSWNAITKWEVSMNSLMIIPKPSRCTRKHYLKIGITEIAWFPYLISWWSITSMKEHWSICSMAKNAFQRISLLLMGIAWQFLESIWLYLIMLITKPNKVPMNQCQISRQTRRSRSITCSKSNSSSQYQYPSLRNLGKETLDSLLQSNFWVRYTWSKRKCTVLSSISRRHFS